MKGSVGMHFCLSRLDSITLIDSDFPNEGKVIIKNDIESNSLCGLFG